MESALSFKAIITVTAALAASALVLRKVMRKRHRPLVLCGPSGVGKGTFITLLMKDFPGMFAKRVSHTTRAPRKVLSRKLPRLGCNAVVTVFAVLVCSTRQARSSRTASITIL